MIPLIHVHTVSEYKQVFQIIKLFIKQILLKESNNCIHKINLLFILNLIMFSGLLQNSCNATRTYHPNLTPCSSHDTSCFAMSTHQPFLNGCYISHRGMFPYCTITDNFLCGLHSQPVSITTCSTSWLQSSLIFSFPGINISNNLIIE